MTTPPPPARPTRTTTKTPTTTEGRVRNVDGRGSLVVAGSGIQLLRQLTPEARDAIEAADEVLYLVSDPATAEWLRSVKPNARSLSELYRSGPPRRQIYAEMVEQILDAVRGGANVCALFYGHPGVYVAPSHLAVAQARQEGYPSRMLPGISAEDCLFADLGVDPADHGWQSYDATDFLLRGYEPDPASTLVLWQVDALGKLDSSLGQEPGSLRVLAERLRELYPGEHELVFYLASSYPIAPSRIERVQLDVLGQLEEAPGPTLYIVPARRRPIDAAVAERLGLRLS